MKITYRILICFIAVLGMCSGLTVSAKDYSKYSTTGHEWGLGLNTNHKVPSGDSASGLKNKRAYYYVNTKKKIIYLTFDCGYENGYTNRILDILKENDLKAMFFVTKSYIQDNPKIVKRMKKEGHLVGNHTATHPSLASCSVARIKKELLDTEGYMKKTTGYSMDHFMRPPMGAWSERSLQVTKDLGYTSVFWSMAFFDYEPSRQPGKQVILNQFMKHYHKGEIVLLHAISKSDTEALPDIIKNMKKKGYEFGELTDLATKNPQLQLSVEDKVYDGKPVTVTTSCKNTTAKVKVTFYDEQGEKLKTAPTEPGSYSVEASVKADNIYKAGKTDRIEFTITQ